MRVGLDLRATTDPTEVLERAIDADRLGLWAVLLGGPAGSEVGRAAALATRTEHIHLAVCVDAAAAHPLTIAEELAILDHVSVRRALAIIDAPTSTVDHVRRLLHGYLVDGVGLAPPPAQTEPPVWALDEISSIALTGDLEADRLTIDECRDAGVAHLFVTWPGPIDVLARHLVTRAAGPDFPQVVADVADRIAPFAGRTE